MSDIRIDSNTIAQTAVTEKDHAEYLTAGGIAILGGLGKGRTSIKGVSVTNNRVETALIGILVLGGGPSREKHGLDNAVHNRVVGVVLRGNVIPRVPRLAKHWFSRIKGISLIGGVAGPARPNSTWRARRNVVSCVTVKGNDVAGKGNKIAVLPNLGAGALRNVARRGGC
ncbi:MAG: hypothetical protein ACRDKB_04530 [Actinomycetota bacterium]